MTREQALATFVTWWRQHITGDEKGEAQLFLNRLLQAFGHEGTLEIGGVPEDRIKRKRNQKDTTSFADLVLPKVALVEMKKRGEDLRKHYQQAFEYWWYLAPNRPKYVVLCNFDELWVYELDYQPDEPRDKVRIEDLPERWGALAFLFPKPETPTFGTDLVQVTKEAAGSLSSMFRNIDENKDKRAVSREDVQRFVLQCMLALFAEDIELLPRYTFTKVVEDCLKGDQSSYDLMNLLFETMNRPGGTKFGRFHDVPYFNGGIFAKITPIHLTEIELTLLKIATTHNWSAVRPAIFGTIFEESMEKKERHQIGAHYTSETDIQRIVQPVIVIWRQQIDAANTVEELRQLQVALSHYRVLDPACGSGNFLYIAYREMKRLEKSILEKIQTLGGKVDLGLGLVTAKQFYGFDIKPFAVELAKVTLMIARKLAVDELGLHEDPLPLDNLDSNIRAVDALLEPWPEFDACIGNPPYLGGKLLKQMYSVDYVNRIRELFPSISGEADYCVYWFRKAHELMKDDARAGLVGTNTIRQNFARKASLDYIVDHDGHIFEAVSSMKWSGEAKVYVSIVCWSKGKLPIETARLWMDGQSFLETQTITSALSPSTDVRSAHALRINTTPKKTFQGQTTGHAKFVLASNQVAEFKKKEPLSMEVIFPYSTGEDLVGQPNGRPSRFTIDLNRLDILEIQKYSVIVEHIKKTVLPDRQAKATEEIGKNKLAKEDNPRATLNHNHEGFLRTWWKHSYGRLDMLDAIQKLSRYVVCSRVTKRPIFDFLSPKIHPSDALQVFTFEDDYSFGILQSGLHWQWFTTKSSTLKGDPRYTPESVFDTFAWPQRPSAALVKAVAATGRSLHEYRRVMMQRNTGLTLRQMYTSLELPGKNPLRDLHQALDKAVYAAYGFDPERDGLEQLLYLNETVYTRIEAGETVTAPGIPAEYPTPRELVSQGCVEPLEL